MSERGRLSSLSSSKGWETENVRAVTGLLVVFAGILAVVALAVVAVALLGGEKDSTVAVTTSALGIISAVVSAYLGIKATANTAAKAAAVTTEKAGEAAVAQNEAWVKEAKINRLNEMIDEGEQAEKIKPEVAKELRDASLKAEEEARKTDPPNGGGLD